MAEIITRPAELFDASAMTGLLIERKYDTVPNRPAENAARIVWWEEFGDEFNRGEIQSALENPSQQMVRIATVGNVAVGYLKATDRLDQAPIDGGPYTNAAGLMVARAFESQGVARQLIRDFCEWALPLNQDVCVSVTVGNQRARGIYESHGCEYVTSVPETYQVPPQDVLVLPYGRLVELANS